jgi:hypothetical protein
MVEAGGPRLGYTNKRDQAINDQACQALAPSSRPALRSGPLRIGVIQAMGRVG